jgi:hypothetical protein
MEVHALSRRIIGPLIAALLALIAATTPVSALPPQADTWHRLNPFTDSGLPEHEQLQCLTNRQWVCRYDKAPGEGFAFDRTIGMFHGRDVDVAAWDCPDWFATDVCEGATQVVAGTMNFSPAAGPAFRVSQELIFTDGDGVAPLYVHWIDFGFACPWYGSFEDALSANPEVQGDCFVAP